MRARASLLCALVACAAAVAAAPARASHSQITTFDAGEELTGSLCCPGLSASALDDAHALGADTVRLLVYWRDVVAAPDSTTKPSGDPGDPAWAGYGQPSPGSPGNGWGKYDELVRGIVARGMSVLMVPTGRFPDGRVPRWASNGPGKDGTDPDPAEYGLFLKALATRYRGGYDPDGAGPLAPLPAIRYVGVWDEPNSPFQLAPQIKNGAPYAPTLYRALYVAGRQGLLTGGFKGKIWIGELAPRGSRTTLGPIPFTQRLLCLRRGKAKRGKRKARLRGRCPRLQADGFAHHPHTGVDPPFRAPFGNGDVTVGNLGRLQALLKRAAAAGAINRLPLEIDEYGVQTNPPDPLFGRTLQEQAEYIGIAEYIAWRNSGIGAWSQYLLRDDASQGGFQSGLRFRDGTMKPSFSAFRTPLVIRKPPGRRPHFVRAWGEVRPVGSAHVQVQRQDGGGAWTPATPSFRTDAAGYFQRKLRYRRGRQFRLVWFDQADFFNVCGGPCVGPPIRAYAFR